MNMYILIYVGMRVDEYQRDADIAYRVYVHVWVHVLVNYCNVWALESNETP